MAAPLAGITVIEAGLLLGLSKNSAYQACRLGQIPVLRLGQRLVVPLGKLSELLGESPETLRERLRAMRDEEGGPNGRKRR